jgi:putative spermidine/putrescine transport system substrate-binding protein
VTAALLLLAGPAGSQAPKQLIVTSFGGAYDEVLKAGAKAFEDKYGARVVIVPSSGADNLVKARNREVDVIHSDPIFSLRSEGEGLFEKLDERFIPNLSKLHPVARYSDYTVAVNMGAYVIAYNPTYVVKPTSWLDLANPKYKDVVGLRAFRPENIDLIVLFAKMAGGSERNPDAGFAKMREIAANVHTWVATHAQMLQLFKSREIWLSIWSDGRINWAQGEGANVKAAIPKEGVFALVTTVNVVKGRPNTELAQRYVNYHLEPASGIAMARALGYSPTNRDVKLPQDLQDKLILNSQTFGQVRVADWRYIVSVYDQWNERWQKEIVR